jgi:methylthioribulose-1-phosphate dehydratase
MLSPKDTEKARELLAAIQFFNHNGWSPATSTNYSVRLENPEQILISRSGVDKSKFQLEDLIVIDLKGNIDSRFQKPGIKSSAETQIHTFLYQQNPAINCVLHTHSVLGTVLSQVFQKETNLGFSGLEILKGLEGNETHELRISLPIVPNSQDMQDIVQDMKSFPQNAAGFLIAGHGLYSWGKNIATAKRHIETYEFLFECYEVMRRNKWPC